MTTLVESADEPVTGKLILDEVLPVADATVSHHVIVDAPAEQVWAALEQLDLVEVLRSSAGVRGLIAAREVPMRAADWLRGRPSAPVPERMLLRELRPWVVLGEQRPHQLVVGVVGRFWGRDIEWLDLEPEEFGPFDRPGYGKIAWGFAIQPYGQGRTLLVDECRTRVTDPASRRRFLTYWALVGRGASFVMRQTIRVVKQHAEE
jgi:hypothetical protein